jgi:Fic family protein
MIRSSAIQITPEILNLIARIDEFKGAWRALGTLAPDRLSALRRVATIESIGSSTRIEGSKLSDREVEHLLSRLQIKSLTTRDEQEVASYAEVLELLFSYWQDITLTENHIKQLHHDLLTYCEKDVWHRGNYKTSANSLVAFDKDGEQLGVAFETATPFDTPILMAELINWFNEERDARRLHPLLLISLWVVVFLEIHPFQDGNGRLSHVIATLLLLQAGYVYAPYSSLENLIEQDKETYYLALQQTQKTIRTESPNWQPWLVFFLHALAEQVRRLNRKMEREKIVLATLPSFSLQIVEFAREHGRVTMGDALRLTSGNRNTLKQHFRALVRRGHLGQHGAGRGAWYEFASSPDVKPENDEHKNQNFAAHLAFQVQN